MSVEHRATQLENSPIREFPAPDVDTTLPQDWKEALLALVTSRVAIVSLEAKEAATSALGRLVPLLIGTVCLVGFWALLVAGAVGGIAAATDWKWYHVAFAAAGVHFLIAAIALLIAKAKRSAPFPVTRAEFEKDREWLNQLNKKND